MFDHRTYLLGLKGAAAVIVRDRSWELSSCQRSTASGFNEKIKTRGSFMSSVCIRMNLCSISLYKPNTKEFIRTKQTKPAFCSFSRFKHNYIFTENTQTCELWQTLVRVQQIGHEVKQENRRMFKIKALKWLKGKLFLSFGSRLTEPYIVSVKWKLKASKPSHLTAFLSGAPSLHKRPQNTFLANLLSGVIYCHAGITHYKTEAIKGCVWLATANGARCGLLL